jgi:hypothetical protein
MMQGSEDLYVTVNGSRKAGMYEHHRALGTLARRVEMPGWLSAVWQSGSGDLLKTILFAGYPKQEIGESRGHIYMRPPPALFTCPAVGLDLEIHEIVVVQPSIQRVRFYVYASGYALAGVWEISADRYLDTAKIVRTKPPFMPQMMVPLTEFAT